MNRSSTSTRLNVVFMGQPPQPDKKDKDNKDSQAQSQVNKKERTIATMRKDLEKLVNNNKDVKTPKEISGATTHVVHPDVITDDFAKSKGYKDALKRKKTA